MNVVKYYMTMREFTLESKHTRVLDMMAFSHDLAKNIAKKSYKCNHCDKSLNDFLKPSIHQVIHTGGSYDCNS
jgi:transposase-like protein